MTRLACVAVVKNEERHIAEWIAWQYAIGFDTVILLDNASTDATVDRALGFAEARDIRILDWHVTDPDYQSRAYSHAVALFGGEFDWMAFFDTDEFLVLDEGLALKSCLEARSEAAGIGVAWAIFGSSGHREIPAGLVVESYLRRSDAGFGPNRHIKSIIRPGAVTAFGNSHVFQLTGPYQDLIGRTLLLDEQGLLTTAPDYQAGKLHHYFTRSWAHWQKKLQRGYHDVLRDVNMFQEYDRNEIFDDSAQRSANAVKALMQTGRKMKQSKVAVVLVVKNEAHDISTWLAWYHNLGFDTCIVFDDYSTDGTWEILQSACAVQDIRLNRLPTRNGSVFQHLQVQAYHAAIVQYKNEFDWLAFFDSDEFLSLKQDISIQSFLARFPEADAVAINWCNYGSSGHVLKPQIPCVEAFTWHGNEQKPINRHIKSIVRPQKVTPRWINMHCFDVEPSRYVLPNGEQVTWSDVIGIINKDPDWSIAKLMHYQCRSMEYFIERLKNRPNIKAVPGLWSAYDVNQIEDPIPQQFLTALSRSIENITKERSVDQGSLVPASNQLSLNEIGLMTKTDKSSSHHGYLDFYDRFFAPLRQRPIKLIEIGVDKGASLRMWETYFVNGNILGIDINTDTLAHAKDRVNIEIADQSKPEELKRIIAQYGPFDIIIDDGSHIWDHQIISMQTLYKAVVPGGYYVIEDLQTSFPHHDSFEHFRGKRQESTARYLSRLALLSIGGRAAEADPDEFLRDAVEITAFVVFQYGTAVIKRKG